jgi:uncharacterized membrane protein
MSQLVVVGFNQLEDARDAMRRLRGLEQAGRIKFEDTAIVERTEDGKAHVRNEASGTTETGAVVGAVLGGLLIFAMPVVGLVIGGAVGAAFGALLDKGVSGKFVDDVKDTLQPGRSALFLVVKDAEADALIPALRDFEGDVIQTTLDDEAEEALRQALHKG